MASKPNNVDFQRRGFGELHSKDQQLKQTKKLCIEKNWNTEIGHILPAEIRPRCEVKKGAKARIGDHGVMEEVWWNWSVELLKALEELSAMTVGDLHYAQELLIIEVEQRQQNPKSSQRKILELLLGDAQRVVDEQRKRVAAGYEVAMEEDHEHENNAYGGRGGEYRALPGPKFNNANGHHNSGAGNPFAHDYSNDDIDDTAGAAASAEFSTPFNPAHHASPLQGVAPTARMTGGTDTSFDAHSRRDVAESLKTTEMKARAARLRAEAVRAEADAIQLEVKARELRERMAELD